MAEGAADRRQFECLPVTCHSEDETEDDAGGEATGGIVKNLRWCVGFAIFEDFDGPEQWSVFEAQMRRVLPEGRLARLDKTHAIFDSFFRIKDIDAILHPMYGLRPSYYGIFEGNDPSRRLMVVANFDNDVPEYWEWSGQGMFAFDASNEAYKLGVNYVIYGMTH